MRLWAFYIDALGQPGNPDTPAIGPVNTPATANTSAVLGTLAGLWRYKEFLFLLSATAITGGPCDYALQRQLTSTLWDDWIRFGTQSAGTGLSNVAIGPRRPVSSQEVAAGFTGAWARSDLFAGSSALTAFNVRGGAHTDVVRLVCRTGAGVTGAASVSLFVVAFEEAQFGMPFM